MAGIIKKQILKHLSKFTKNLSADKINLSTLRGEGELTNLELDCVALQNVMNLPTWLQISNATCNRVSVKIAWTKLKTVPICIYLDAVEVDMKTCEKPRAPNGPSPIQASASSGDTSYGFTEKVLEGMTVNINSISVNFTSAAFNATFQLSQLSVISTNPSWQKADLRFSRITDKTLGQVLTFKKISWQTMRIVADAITTNEKSSITPLRLITNQSEIKMTFRRRTSDCYVLASRLHVHFDDLLWVLTDSQVQSALLCVKSLRDTIDRSNQQMRELGLDKAQEAQQSPAKPAQGIPNDSNESQLNNFAQHTVIESSYHIDFDRVDLHICEEGTPVHQGSKSRNLQGGAIQISLHNLKVDHYPYHKAASERTHFRDSGDTMTERNSWAKGIIDQFRKDFSNLKHAADQAGNTTHYQKSIKLVESCLSVRLTDIDIHQVTTSKSKKHASGRLLNSTRKELHLPDEMPLFHFIRTEYYYPDGRDYPAPHNNIFMQLNAPRLHAHWDSLLWLNRLTLTTVQAVQKMLEDLGIIADEDEDLNDAEVSSSVSNEEEHVDIRIQILMPKVFIPGPPSTHDKQPHGLEIQVSRAAVTNCRDGADCTRAHLKRALDLLDEQYMARNNESFPSEQDIDLPFMSDMLRRHAKGEDLPMRVNLKRGNPALTGTALKSLAINDVWSVDLEQVWIDFIMPGAKANSNLEKEDLNSSGGFLGTGKPVIDPIANGLHLPFMDSFPVTLWIRKTPGSSDGAPKLATASISSDGTCNSSLSMSSLSVSKGEISNSNSNQSDFSNQLSCHTSPMNEPMRNRSHTDIDNIIKHQQETPKLSNCTAFTNSTPDVRSSRSDPTGSFSLPVDESPRTPGQMDSPRTKRNQRLLDYYRSSMDETTKKDPDTVSQDSKDRISMSSTSSSHRQKMLSTHILIHTEKLIGLQLDHHQYLFLLRMIDHVEDVGKQLDLNSEQILNSAPSSSFSSPTHSVSNAGSESSHSASKKRSKTLNTTSIRLSSPSANLYLILRPPPPNVVQDEDLSSGQNTQTQMSSLPGREETSSLNSVNLGSDLGSSKGETSTPKSGDIVTPHPPLPKPLTVQDTPPLSECGSDSQSIQGSDNISIFGDSVAPPGSGVYPHSDPINTQVNRPSLKYPHETTDPEIPLKRSDNPSVASEVIKTTSCKIEKQEDAKTSLLKQKSGSLSTLSSSSADPLDANKALSKNLSLRNHSSDNLVSGSLLSDQPSLGSANATKSNSSGYESGSHESLAPPSVKNLARSETPSSSSPRSSHSHSSSDASDQFVLIQVDELGRGLDDNGVIKLNRKMNSKSPASTVDSSSVRSETSSISSSQGFTTTPTSDSKTTLEQDSLSGCGLADSQITVTNMRSSASSSVSSSDEKLTKQEPLKQEEKEKISEPEMSSLVRLHVSHGVELSVDSNDTGDSVVKIVASAVDVAELGLLKTEKVDSIFVNYAPKKRSSSSTPERKVQQAPQRVQNKPLSPNFCLRVDSGPLAGRFSPNAAKAGHIQISANKVPLTLKSSTLANLGAFVEDEVVPEIVPMKIDAKDVKLTIKDDMPAAYEATPRPPPVTLLVHSATVRRTDDGTFHVNSTTSGSISSFGSKPTTSQNQDVKENEKNDMIETNGGTEPQDQSVFPTEMSSPPSHSVREHGGNSEITVKERTENKSPSVADATTVKPLLVNGHDADSVAKMERKYIDMKERMETLQAERDALASALRHMQEELIASEKERSNLRSQIG